MSRQSVCQNAFFFNDTATTEIYTLSLHDALPIYEFLAIDRVEAARHPLRHPVIAALGKQMPVAARHLLADVDEVVGAQAGVDLEVFQRPEKAVDMVAQLERRALEGPRAEARRVGKELRSRLSP